MTPPTPRNFTHFNWEMQLMGFVHIQVGEVGEVGEVPAKGSQVTQRTTHKRTRNLGKHTHWADKRGW